MNDTPGSTTEQARPSTVLEAILKTTLEVPSLAKGERNQYGKYNYVSIDRYYETVAKIAARNGLHWVCRTTGAEVQRDLGREGAIIYNFAFDLSFDNHKAADDDGYPLSSLLKDYTAFTVVHPIQGAQTAGSAASYAEKLFMRTIFKVVTGEEDADATDPKGITPESPKIMHAPSPQTGNIPQPADLAKLVENMQSGLPKITAPDADPAELVENMQSGLPKITAPADGDWSLVSKVFSTFAPLCSTTLGLMQWWRDNLSVIERAQKEGPAEYENIKRAFTERKMQLKELGK